jgi:hypothetical protein
MHLRIKSTIMPKQSYSRNRSPSSNRDKALLSPTPFLQSGTFLLFFLLIPVYLHSLVAMHLLLACELHCILRNLSQEQDEFGFGLLVGIAHVKVKADAAVP